MSVVVKGLLGSRLLEDIAGSPDRLSEHRIRGWMADSAPEAQGSVIISAIFVYFDSTVRIT